VVRGVLRGSPAEAAGVKSGDVLLALGNLAVTDLGFAQAYRSRFGKNEGDSLPIKVRRGNDTLTLSSKVVLVARVEHRIVSDSAASAKAARIRDGILTGKLD
jgi:S1-C subfamily serine protease